MPKKQLVTAWVTTYAINSRILKVTGEVALSVTGTDRYLSYYDPHDKCYRCAYSKDWHLTETEAFNRANAMRMSAIAELERRTKTLLDLKFSPSRVNDLTKKRRKR